MFFIFLFFFVRFFFYELACQNIHEKDMTDTIKHFEQQTLQLCVLSCILFIQKSSSVFQSCDRSNLTTQGKKKKKKKKKKKRI